MSNLLYRDDNFAVIQSDLLAHTPDEHDYDNKGNIIATRKATVPVIGCWAGKEWQL